MLVGKVLPPELEGMVDAPSWEPQQTSKVVEGGVRARCIHLSSGNPRGFWTSVQEPDTKKIHVCVRMCDKSYHSPCLRNIPCSPCNQDSKESSGNRKPQGIGFPGSYHGLIYVLRDPFSDLSLLWLECFYSSWPWAFKEPSVGLLSPESLHSRDQDRNKCNGNRSEYLFLL